MQDGQSYLDIANSSVIWMLCAVTVGIAFLQAILFMCMARRTRLRAGIPAEISSKALRVGLITSIGPALGVFIVMVGLMAAIGGPMAWMRLSIIGAAPTELTAATYGAQASGVELGGTGYDLTVMSVCLLHDLLDRGVVRRAHLRSLGSGDILHPQCRKYRND